MAPDTPQAEPPTPPLPWSRLNVTPPLPVAQLRNDELELLVGSRALFASGQPPDVQDQVDERIRQAWAELNHRGVHQVPVTHWNFGRANEKPIDPSLSDEHWYKRPMPSQPGSLTQREERDAALHQRYLAYLVRFERWNKPKGWARFMGRHPLAALAALTKGRELPREWCRQPMGEVDFQIEILVGRAKRMGRL